MMNFESIGGRRYLLTFASGISATILQWNGKLDPAGTSYAAVILGIVAAYITGNTIQKKNEGEAK